MHSDKPVSAVATAAATHGANGCSGMPSSALLLFSCCVQRAHQNSLENQPIFLSLLTLSGLQYPVTAASFGALYLAGRIGYVQVRLICVQLEKAAVDAALCSTGNVRMHHIQSACCWPSLPG